MSSALRGPLAVGAEHRGGYRHPPPQRLALARLPASVLDEPTFVARVEPHNRLAIVRRKASPLGFVHLMTAVVAIDRRTDP